MASLSHLNPQQREAVESVHGPLLILAGAGSGKTRVITHRIAQLIEEHGVSPDSILAVTFTNKASREMMERVEKLLSGRSLLQAVISTFHSFCVRVLRRDIEAMNDVFRRDFAIYDESDQQSVVKAAMRRLGVDDKQLQPRAVLGRISWAKNHMMDPAEVYQNSGDPKTERVAQIYEVYRQELRKANALDFDDILLYAVRLLKVAPQVREKYNRRFQYILIDEYQDTNRPQYELMKLLAGTHHNICVVGDEDQSIYSWRGADIRNILEFERDFPGAKVIRLEQNYRSTEVILEAASAVVANNKQRKGKKLWTDRGGGTKITYYEAPDGENEALYVADAVNSYMNARDEDGAEKKAAILYRTNSQSRVFEESLRRYGLKYNVVGGFSFYDRAEIKDMISYLKLALNPDDSIAFLRVVNTPARGIGKTTVETLERLALETGKSLWGATEAAIEQKLLPMRTLNALQSFKQVIEDARAMMLGSAAQHFEDTSHHEGTKGTKDEDLSAQSLEGTAAGDTSFNFGLFDSLSGDEESAPEQEVEAADITPEGAQKAEAIDGFRAPGEAAQTPELLKFLIDRTGYIKQLEEEGSPEAFSRIDNLRELVNAAMDSRDRGETLGEFLDHAALVSDTDQYEPASGITLMTLHSAKGLEFPKVYLVGMEEGLFPHSRTFLNPDEIEEERRLCYVGMTRAMQHLTVSRARYRRRYGTDMPEASVSSRFLEEIPAKLIEPAQGSMAASGGAAGRGRAENDYADTHYSYEDEDQSRSAYYARAFSKSKTKYAGAYNSAANITDFFASRGKKGGIPKMQFDAPAGTRGLRPGTKVRHPKFGEGVVQGTEGSGDGAKITIQFPRFGIKTLVEKYAQLERV